MSPQIFIRQPVPEDWQELLYLHQNSQDLHFPWVRTPLTAEDCKNYIQRCQRTDYEGLMICQSTIDPISQKVASKIIGVANFSQIFYRSLQSTYLGYYISADFAGQGLMFAGMRLAIDYAFDTLKLHRIEANIQPENTRSINLVKRLGFTKEGFSPRYLYINDEWRDHERWALTVENWQ